MLHVKTASSAQSGGGGGATVVPQQGGGGGAGGGGGITPGPVPGLMVSADEKPSGEKVVKHPEYSTVERTIVERNAELIDRYGAHHVGVSKKFRKGRRMPDTCITFYVTQKGKSVPAQQVPKEMDLSYKHGSRKRSIVTDVCEVKGKPVGFNMRGGNLVIAKDGETGTVGLVFRQGGSDLFLTNAHVATDPGAPPGKVRVKVPEKGTVFGDVSVIDDLTAAEIRSDAALVIVPPNSVAPGQFRGINLILESCGEIANNDPRRFFYVAKDVSGPKDFVHEVRWRAFVPATAEITIDDLPLQYASFHIFDLVVGQCGPGHSGAVIFCQSNSGLKAVGLLFGGIEETNEVWVFPVRRCLERMGVDPDSL